MKKSTLEAIVAVLTSAETEIDRDALVAELREELEAMAKANDERRAKTAKARDEKMAVIAPVVLEALSAHTEPITASDLFNAHATELAAVEVLSVQKLRAVLSKMETVKAIDNGKNPKTYTVA